MKITVRSLLWAVLLCAAATIQAQAQTPAQRTTPRLPGWGLKTNLLYDATATINMGLEWRLGKNLSLDLPVSYNPWTLSESRQWQHLLVQPELRFWPAGAFSRHFFGVHGHYADYQLNNLPEPFSIYMRAHTFDGWLAGAGASYGYRWNLGRRLAIEATVGAGYIYLSYDKHETGSGQAPVRSETHYFGPTKAGLNLIFGLGGGKQQRRQPQVSAAPVPVTHTAPASPAPPQADPTPWVPVPGWEPVAAPILIYEPTLLPTFTIPEVETVKSRSDAGLASLDFQRGSAEIRPGFRNNAAELRGIHALTEALKGAPNVTIMGITINGYASPEGEYTKNRDLSARRAEALRDHVAAVNGLSTDLFTVWGGGEDWALLDSLVSHSRLNNKYRILEIIRSTEYFDIRYRKLAALAGGAPLRQMESQFFANLRRSDYRINYTVAPFDVEQARQTIGIHPDHLSLNEMYHLAEAYAPASDAAAEVYRIAAREFPDSDVANLNAAANALLRQDENTAIDYLNRVKEASPAYWNNLGLLCWIQGDKARAAECFARGGEQGAANAGELDRHVDSILAR